MAITRAQIARELYRVGGASGREYGADTSASRSVATSPSRDTGNDRGRDPTAQFESGKKPTKEAEKALKAQRKEARYQITPSRYDETRPSNRIISALLSSAIPFGGMIYNRAINQRAMGFGPPKIKKEPTDIIFNDDDNDNQNMMAQPITPYQEDLREETVNEEDLSPKGLALALLERERMGGARAFAKEGGIMDLDQARQGYKLGKLVKKVTRGLKKIVKSPVGAAALASFIPFGKGDEKASLFSRFMKTGVGENIGDFFSNMDTSDRYKLGIGAALTAAPLFFQDDDSDEEYQKFLAQRNVGGQLPASIPDIRKNYRDYMARAFVADGGRPEPVAKKTMPLLDMDGKEKDYRETGGFVDMGRMERADDVPARLSKNEFVFTADAVRNAGDGDIDKGAEVMYNMMKNLEAGGEVSEESQGLDGARKMFQTSQRLEEVL